ncbi:MULTISPECIES: hypothetical protein [Parabacteroides]|uniref:hypothetical protein n=1 Tax=Parabacteroides sp. AT13 TaxID=2025877 RepID=UPI0026E546BA|nr:MULTISPECIES: hypothetical protein [Parabacteroides]
MSALENDMDTRKGDALTLSAEKEKARKRADCLSKGNWQTNRRSYKPPTDSFPTSRQTWMPLRNARNSSRRKPTNTPVMSTPKWTDLLKDVMLENMSMSGGNCRRG